MMDIEKVRSYFRADRYAMEVTGIEIEEIGETGATCGFTLEDRHLNAGNRAQGGAIFTLADFTFAVAANAVHICQENTVRAVSQTVSITYIAAGMPGGRLKAEARQISYRRSTCLYEVRVTDEGGQLVALATVNGFIRGKTN